MPVFDILAFTRFVIRVSFIVALVIYIGGFAVVIKDVIINFWILIVDSFSLLNGYFNSSSGNLSCFFTMLSTLGISESLASFLITSTSLLVLWASTLINVLLFRYLIQFKRLLIEGVK